MKSKLKTFDDKVKQILKLEDLETDGEKPNPHQWADLLDSDPDFQEELFPVYQDDGIKETDDEPTPEIADQFLKMELALPRDGEGPEFARVKKRLRDEDGNPVGRASDNLMTDTRIFEVKYQDGHYDHVSQRDNRVHVCAGWPSRQSDGCQYLQKGDQQDHQHQVVGQGW